MSGFANKSIILVGGGNMGSSLVKGMLANQWRAERITICEQDSSRRKWLNSEFPQCQVIDKCVATLPPASVVILAVKPQDMRATCQRFASGKIPADVLFISIAAGVPTRALQQWLGAGTSVIRCMPNTPAAIGHGMTGLYAGEKTTAADKKFAQEILSSAGKILWVQDEAMLDAVTAISGSGPAYLFYFMECLQQSAQTLGLSAEDSYTLTLQTMAGAALLAQEQNLSFAQLRANVTSKGGTTEQAITCFAENDIKKIIDAAIKAAAARAGEISNSFSED